MLFLLAVLAAAPPPPLPPPTLPPVQPSAEPPALRWDSPTMCVDLAPSPKVPSGHYRVQCDEAKQQCLASPTAVLVDGVESHEELGRVNPCAWSTDLAARAVSLNWPFFEAAPEAPPGWYRDERYRVMQVNFDLTRRVYLGASWAPLFSPGAGASLGRVRPELGVEVSFPGGDERSVHRLHFLEGWVQLGTPDVRLEATVARYDASLRRASPLLWITTFVGAPRRYDLDLNFTFAFDLLRFEYLAGSGFMTIASADVVLDLWHSQDLESYVRARLGPALEYDLVRKGASFRPEAAVEADLTLDRDGFHHLTGALVGEQLLFAPRGPLEDRPLHPTRVKARLGYEVILLAINDYPLSLVVNGRATWRNDVAAVAGWEFGADAGLRFSFWAPARRSASAVTRR